MPILLLKGNRLTITQSASRALAQVCEQAHPLEAYGFLLGREEIGQPIITGVLPGRESAQGLGSFSISDHELRLVAAYAEDRGLRILALFHSHPSGDHTLSSGDLASLRYSAWPWVIVTRPDAASIVLTGYSPPDAARIPVQAVPGAPC